MDDYNGKVVCLSGFPRRMAVGAGGSVGVGVLRPEMVPWHLRICVPAACATKYVSFEFSFSLVCPSLLIRQLLQPGSSVSPTAQTWTLKRVTRNPCAVLIFAPLSDLCSSFLICSFYISDTCTAGISGQFHIELDQGDMCWIDINDTWV